jgi:hypothetical protein
MSISVTTNSADNGNTERGRKLGLEEFELGMRDDATPEQLEVLLAGLRQLRDRVDQGQLEPDDKAILYAVISGAM